jgi:hypothetical protein
MDFQKEYQIQCNTVSDIYQHLPILYESALECQHITEMGVRTGASTRAFLYANPQKLVSYDIFIDPEVNSLFDFCKKEGKEYSYIQADVLKIEIEETDFLFIDTYHCYEQLSKELELHSNKVRKYIGFHDTFTYGKYGENLENQSFAGTKGIMFAIEEFLDKNKNWKIVHDVDYNNGLIIIEKQ